MFYKTFNKQNSIVILLLSMMMGPVALNIAGKTPNLFWQDVVVSLLVVRLCCKRIITREAFFILPPKLLVCFFFYSVSIVYSLFLSENILVSVAVAKLYILPLVVFYLAYSTIKTEEDIKQIVFWMVVISLYFSISSLYNWHSYDTQAKILQDDLGTKDMVQTVTGRSNSVAGVNVLLFPMCIYLATSKHKVQQLMSIVAMFTLLSSTFFAMSRGALVALATGLAAYILLSLRQEIANRRMTVGVSIVIVGVLVASYFVMPAGLQQMLESRFDQSIYEATTDYRSNSRLVRWQTSLQLFTQYPLGIGVGNYRTVMSTANSQMGGSAHNLFIETLIETSAFGLLPLLGILWCYGRNLLALLSHSSTARERCLAIVLVMVFCTYIVSVSLEPNYYSVTFTYLFSILMAMSYSIGKLACRL
jgi:hypothetical protein